MQPRVAIVVLVSLGVFAANACAAPAAADASRQAEVSKRGAEVMPFDLKATKHVFTKTPEGGVEQVVARNPHDAEQVRLIREHLRQVAAQFERGDFAAPEQIHGESMPGLAELEHAKRGEIRIRYRNLSNGGEIHFSSRKAALVSALHRWFDAQVSDHGPDAVAGHEHMKHD